MNRIIAIIAILTSIVGGVLAVESRYAQAEDVKKLRTEFQQSILENKIDRLQERIWKITDRGVKTVSDNDNLRRLEQDKDRAEQQLEALEKKVLK